MGDMGTTNAAIRKIIPNFIIAHGDSSFWSIPAVSNLIPRGCHGSVTLWHKDIPSVIFCYRNAGIPAGELYICRILHITESCP